MDAPRYRIGNTLTVLWSICNNDGTPFDLSSKDIKLFFTNSRGATQIEDYTIVENGDSGLYNIIRWEYSGDDQKTLGDHTLTIEIYPSGSNRKIKRDVCKAFCLVSRSESEESGGEGNILDSGSLILSSNLDVYRFGRASVEIGTNGNWFIDGFDTGKSALAGGPGLVKNVYNESDLSREFDKNSVIDTFNADTIKKIYDALKGFTMKDITDLSIADLETNDIVAFNGDNWVSIPFKTLFDIYRMTEFVSIAGEGGGDGYWYLDEKDGMVHIDKDIYVHGNILLDGDEASMGRGQDTPGGGGGTVVATLEDLTDVEFSNLSDGDTIIFDTESGFWKNVPLKDAGAQEAVDKLSDHLNEMWRLEEGVIVANKPVWLKSNLLIDGDEASMGDGEDNGGGNTSGDGIGAIIVDGENQIRPSDDGVINISEDLARIYAKKENLNSVEGRVKTLEDAGYVTEVWVNNKDFATAAKLNEEVGKINGLIGGKADKSDSLAGYGINDAYTKTEIDGKVKEINDALGIRYTKTETDNLLKNYVCLKAATQTIEGDIIIKGNLFIEGDEASTGDGEDNVKGTVRGIKVSSGNTLFPETDGIVDMTEFFSELNFDVDLSGYYTSKQIDTKIGDITTTIDSLSNRIGSIETLIGEDKDTIEGTIDTFYEIEHFLSGIGNTTLNNIIEQFVPKTTKIAQGTGISVSGDGSLSSDVTISLMPTGVTAGTYTKVTVDQYGRATSGSALLSLTDVTGLQAKLQSIDSELTAKVGISNKETITGAKTFSALATFNNGMSIKGDVTIDGNLFITGDEASMGEGGSGSGGGMNEESLEAYLSNNDYIYGTINGGRWANNVFAPITAGTSGQVLVSRGSTSTPEWKDVADLGMSGGTFEGGALSDNIWFTKGYLGVVTATSKLNVIRGQEDEVMVGSGSIPRLLMRASNIITTVFGINEAMHQRDGHTDLFTKTIIDPGATYSYDDPFRGFTDQDDWSMFVKGNMGVYMGGINIYTGVANPYFRMNVVGGLLNIFAYDTPIATTYYDVLTLSGYSFSMLWRGLQLRLSNDSQKSSALQFYDETDNTRQFLGIDASKNLIYNSNVVLHSGNYTDFISGDGSSADLSSYYTKTEVDSGFVSKNAAIQYVVNNMRLDLDSTNQYSSNYISFSRNGTMIGGIGITAATNVLYFGPSTINYITVDTDGPAYTLGTYTYRILHSGNYTDYISESGGSTDGGGSTASAASPPMMIFAGLDELSDFTENGIANGQVLLLQTTSSVSLQTIFKNIFPKTDSDGNRLSTTIYIKARSGYETGRLSVPVYQSSGIMLINPNTGVANNTTAYTFMLGFSTIMLTHCGEYWVANLIA